MGQVQSARFRAVQSGAQTLTNRTSEVVNWDTTPSVNTPSGYFSNTLSSTSESTATNPPANAVTINVTGIYLMSVSYSFDPPAGTSEFVGIWVYRNKAGVTTFDRFICGGKAAEGGPTHLSGSVVVRVTQSDITNGDNTFQILVYQAEVTGTTGSGGGTAAGCYWDILRLDSI